MALNSGFNNNKNVVAFGGGNVQTLYTSVKLSSSVDARTKIKDAISNQKVFSEGTVFTDGQPSDPDQGHFGDGS